MIEVEKDHKSDGLIITRTDSEGFHRQLQIGRNEAFELYAQLMKMLYQKQ